MIIYNVTILIDSKRESEFIDWMQNKHLKDVLDTGLFSQAIFTRLLTETGTEDGVTYATQYYCESQEQLQKYYEEFAPRLRKEGINKFGEDMVGFRTELEVLEVVEK